MEGVAGVEIDPEGRFKYILVRVWREGGEAATLVRGTAKAEFHPDILAKVAPGLEGLGLSLEVQGGGKILHCPGERTIKVFSKSTGQPDTLLCCLVDGCCFYSFGR